MIKLCRVHTVIWPQGVGGRPKSLLHINSTASQPQYPGPVLRWRLPYRVFSKIHVNSEDIPWDNPQKSIIIRVFRLFLPIVMDFVDVPSNSIRVCMNFRKSLYNVLGKKFANCVTHIICLAVEHEHCYAHRTKRRPCPVCDHGESTFISAVLQRLPILEGGGAGKLRKIVQSEVCPERFLA